MLDVQSLLKSNIKMDLSALKKQLPTITSRNVFKVSKIFTVEQNHLVFSNGAERDYERIKSNNGAVMCVPFDGKHFILTVEYAGALERYELSLVKGKIDDNEEDIVAANRELQEEIGFRANHLTLLKDELCVAPGMLELRMYAYLCTDLQVNKLNGDEPEAIECVYLTPSEVKELIFNSKSCLTESRTIAALTLALHKLGFLS